jgi:hypothetical protein
MTQFRESAGVIQTNKKILSAVIDNEVVLMSVDQGRYYALDDVASDIWRRLARAPTQTELINELVEHYNGDREHIERDVAALLVRLAGEGLIDVQP